LTKIRSTKKRFFPKFQLQKNKNSKNLNIFQKLSFAKKNYFMFWKNFEIFEIRKIKFRVVFPRWVDKMSIELCVSATQWWKIDKCIFYTTCKGHLGRLTALIFFSNHKQYSLYRGSCIRLPIKMWNFHGILEWWLLIGRWQAAGHYDESSYELSSSLRPELTFNWQIQ